MSSGWVRVLLVVVLVGNLITLTLSILSYRAARRHVHPLTPWDRLP